METHLREVLALYFPEVAGAIDWTLHLKLLSQELSLGEIAGRLEIDLKTASEHLRRLAIAGLVLKRHAGREVLHGLTVRSKQILTFLRKLE